MQDLENIKVGDRLLYGQWDYRNQRLRLLAIYTVTKVTAKKFATSKHPALHAKSTGREYRGSQYFYQRVATPQECERWEAAQEAKRIALEAARVEQEQTEKKRAELYSLFADKERVAVNDTNGLWQVFFVDLTEAEVHALADKVK